VFFRSMGASWGLGSWTLPSYAPIALAFWLLHAVCRVQAGGRVGLFDVVLPVLLFAPWMLRPRAQRVILSVATYFAVYYAAFLPLLDSITARADWHAISALEAVIFPVKTP